jgi:hypothetical protein
MARSWFRRAFLGGTLGAALLLSSTAMAQAQLTDIEKSCRMNGAIAHEIAFDRDRGFSLEGSLLIARKYAASFNATPERLRYLEKMVHAVYGLSGLTALEHGKLQEILCVDILLKEREQQAMDEQRIRELLRLAELEAELARRDAIMDDIFGKKKPAPKKKAPQGTTLAKDPNRY